MQTTIRSLTATLALALFGLTTLTASSALAAKPIPATFKCSKADIAKTKCAGPNDCLYPHPTDKTAFIHCSVNPDGETGTPALKTCPDSLVWNDNIKRCDFRD